MSVETIHETPKSNDMVKIKSRPQTKNGNENYSGKVTNGSGVQIPQGEQKGLRVCLEWTYPCHGLQTGGFDALWDRHMSLFY